MARNISDENKRLQKIAAKSNIGLFGDGSAAHPGLKELKRLMPMAIQAIQTNKIAIRKNQTDYNAAMNGYADGKKKWLDSISDATYTPIDGIRKASINTARMDYDEAIMRLARDPSNPAIIADHAAKETTYNTAIAGLNFDISNIQMIERSRTEAIRLRKSQETLEKALDNSIREFAEHKNKLDELYPELKEMTDLAKTLGGDDSPFKFVFGKGKATDLALKANEIQKTDLYSIFGKVAKSIKDSYEGSSPATQKQVMELLRRENLDDAQKLKLQGRERMFGEKGNRRATSGLWQWLMGFFSAFGLGDFFKAYDDHPFTKMRTGWAQKDKEAASKFVSAIKDGVKEALAEAKQVYAEKKNMLKNLSDQVEQLGLEKLEDTKTTDPMSPHQTVDDLADDMYSHATGLPTSTARAGDTVYQPAGI